MIMLLIYSILLTFLVELIHFKSLKLTSNFFIENINYAFVNFLIISSTIIFVYLFKRKFLWLFFISFIWIFISIVNTIVTNLRGLPVMFSDIFLIKEAFSLLRLYFDYRIMLLLMILCIIVSIAMIYLIKFKIYTRFKEYIFCIIYLLVGVITLYTVEVKSLMPPLTWDYIYSYNTYGLAYSLLNTVYPYFTSEPDLYTENNVDKIYNNVNLAKESESLDRLIGNVIIIQLESFIDPTLLQGVEYNINPIENFESLKRNSIYGNIQVPTFGGGTAITEFEVLTSIESNALRPGEVPYSSVLRLRPLESLATIFRKLGNKTTVIHNYQGNFYNRHIAMSNLGFETYIPLEYMTGFDGTNEINYMDDVYLFDYIINSLEKSDNQDFIYAISTGTHQPYADNNYDETSQIQIYGEMPDNYRNTLQDYLIRLNKLDQQINRLMNYLKNFNEPTTVVLLSDHLPNLPIINDTLQDYLIRLNKLDQQINRLMNYLKNFNEPTTVVLLSDHLPNLPIINDDKFYNQDIYLAPYLIYNNYSLEYTDIEVDMLASELGVYLLELLEINSGIMNGIQRTYRDSEYYEDILELIQYDMLYGDEYVYKNVKKTEASINSGIMNGIQRTYRDSEYYEDILELIQYDMLYGDEYVYKNVKKTEASILNYGLDEITINEIIIEDDRILLSGNGFSINSKVFIDGKIPKQRYINQNLLEVYLNYSDYELIEIKQISGGEKVIGEVYKINFSDYKDKKN